MVIFKFLSAPVVFLSLLAVACGAATTPAPTLASVISIHDGDTLTAVISGGRQIKVRLANIDAPELAQAYGPEAGSALRGLVLGRMVELVGDTIDRYGRTVAIVLMDGVDVDAVMVTKGLAWVYTKYNTDASLPALEAEARQARRGLWADDNPMPPWEWRHP